MNLVAGILRKVRSLRMGRDLLLSFWSSWLGAMAQIPLLFHCPYGVGKGG